MWAKNWIFRMERVKWMINGFALIAQSGGVSRNEMTNLLMRWQKWASGEFHNDDNDRRETYTTTKKKQSGLAIRNDHSSISNLSSSFPLSPPLSFSVFLPFSPSVYFSSLFFSLSLHHILPPAFVLAFPQYAFCVSHRIFQWEFFLTLLSFSSSNT